MEIDFRHELMQSYLNKIVEACKEKKILEATIYGLASQIAEMMNVRLSRFENKGLKVLRSDECVRYWLISAEAKTNIVWRDNIHVVFNLVCSPTDIVGKRKLTKKEKEIVAELLEIWDKNLKRGYFGNKEE